MSNGMAWVSVDVELPRSGVPVLAAFRNSLGNARVVRAQYADAKTLPLSEDAAFVYDTDFGDWDEESGEWFAPAGWYESNEYEETHWSIGDRVTHWMRLPLHPDSVSSDTQKEAAGQERLGL